MGISISCLGFLLPFKQFSKISKSSLVDTNLSHVKFLQSSLVKQDVYLKIIKTKYCVSPS